MSRLFLLRHAKAGWAEPGMRDFDRPLEPLGRTDADAIGAAMRTNSYIPDLVLCSSAKRARETLDWVARHIGSVRIIHSDSLYSTDAAGYVEFIRATANGDQVLLVGHNPMMEDVATALSGGGDANARSTLGAGFPTSALAVIRFDGSLSETAPGKGHLEAFLTPADL
jgi:phosphohistidine phosphatase